MKCCECGNIFPSSIVIEGKRRFLRNRRRCFKCSPFGTHNNTLCSDTRAKRGLLVKWSVIRSVNSRGNKSKRYKISEPCHNCGKNPPRWASTSKYCNSACQKEHRIKLKDAEILSGKKVGVYKLRSFLFRTRDRKCSICGRTHWCGKPIPLIMDHINGNPLDDSLINLRLVCGNCDMQLPTYKSKNNGHGRHKRLMQYRKQQAALKAISAAPIDTTTAM